MVVNRRLVLVLVLLLLLGRFLVNRLLDPVVQAGAVPVSCY